jgi:transposase
MEPYPIELRRRILNDCDAGMEARLVALKYQVSESWLRRLKQRRRERGEIAARRSGWRRPPKWAAHAERIKELVQQRPDATLTELRDELGIDISIATLSRALRALQITFKKKCFARPSKTVRTSKRDVPIGRPR